MLALLLGVLVVSAAASKPAEASPVELHSDRVPNLFYSTTGDKSATKSTVLIADPINDFLLEVNSFFQCKGDQFSMIAMDLRKFKVRSRGCLEQPNSLATPYFSSPSTGLNLSSAGLYAVDSTDQVVIFAAQENPDEIVPVHSARLVLFSETTLRPIATWALPASAARHISGLTWVKRDNRLLVVTDGGDRTANRPRLPTMAVTMLDVTKGLLIGSTAEIWTQTLTNCSYELNTHFAVPNAQLTVDPPAVFVPCELSDALGQKEGVVRIDLTSGKPNSSVGVAVVPGQATDWLFDVASARGFFVAQTPSGTTVLTYDGRLGAFLGRSAVGTKADINRVVLGTEPVSGRLYALGLSSGLTLMDGRRTPLSPGARYPEFAGPTTAQTIPILPADGTHPHPRLLINYVRHPDGSFCAADNDPQCGVPYYTLLTDAEPVSGDPPAADLDRNTHVGTLTKSQPVTTFYTGTARGFGWHSTLVGSYGGVVDNRGADLSTPIRGKVPLWSGNRDLLGAWVDHVALGTSGSSGMAVSLGDSNGSTEFGYQDTVANRLTQLGAPSSWPFMKATCSEPGSADQGSQRSEGVHPTDASSLPLSDRLSHSSVTCAGQATAKAVGASELRGGDLSDLLPSVSVADSSVVSEVEMGGNNSAVTSSTNAVASGIRVRVGSQVSLYIGAVTQTAVATARGTAGSARTERKVTISGIVVNGQVLCDQACSVQVLDQINTRFPALLNISVPPADRSLAPGLTSNGSPGGYAAVVQATPTQQFGDRQFNGFGSEESTLLPALRVVIYDDGNYQLSRQVLDLAGVEDDAEFGIQLLPQQVGEDFNLGVPRLQHVQPVKASIDKLIPRVGHVSALTSSSVFERVFSGFSWVLRSPFQAARMLGFIALLTLPAFAASRRRLWISEFGGDEA